MFSTASSDSNKDVDLLQIEQILEAGREVHVHLNYRKEQAEEPDMSKHIEHQDSSKHKSENWNKENEGQQETDTHGVGV